MNYAGTAGADFITGTGDADTVIGYEGDDTINGGGGADAILGNQGNDSITDGDGNATIYGGKGNDQITVGNGINLIYGDEGADTITAGNGGNTIVGGAGNPMDSLDGADLIRSGSGADLIISNGGDDTVAAGDGADTVVAGMGNDAVLGNMGNDILLGNQGNDTLYGGKGDDNIYGGKDNDLLFGNEGNNTIHGNEGDDTVGFAGNRSSYSVVQNTDGSYLITGNGTTDLVDTTEHFQFADGTVDAANLIPPPNNGGGGGGGNPPPPPPPKPDTFTYSADATIDASGRDVDGSTNYPVGAGNPGTHVAVARNETQGLELSLGAVPRQGSNPVQYALTERADHTFDLNLPTGEEKSVADGGDSQNTVANRSAWAINFEFDAATAAKANGLSLADYDAAIIITGVGGTATFDKVQSADGNTPFILNGNDPTNGFGDDDAGAGARGAQKQNYAQSFNSGFNNIHQLLYGTPTGAGGDAAFGATDFDITTEFLKKGTSTVVDSLTVHAHVNDMDTNANAPKAL